MSYELEKVEPKTTALALPDFMQQDAGEGIAEMVEFIRPSRLKIIQDNTKNLDMFNAGDVALLPEKLGVDTWDKYKKQQRLSISLRCSFILSGLLGTR